MTSRYTSALSRLCERLDITCDAQYGVVDLPADWAPDAHPYKCTLRFERRTLTVPFYCGSGVTTEPDASDVLSCLCSDAMSVENARDFADWCSDMGTNTDSRKAEATYKACAKLAPKLRRFLGDRFDEVCRAEH